jgi:hypothetical protein
MKKATDRGGEDKGPVRTLKVGDRITVYGDVEVIAIEDRRVTLRVMRASSPPPEGLMLRI